MVVRSWFWIKVLNLWTNLGGYKTEFLAWKWLDAATFKFNFNSPRPSSCHCSLSLYEVSNLNFPCFQLNFVVDYRVLVLLSTQFSFTLALINELQVYHLMHYSVEKFQAKISYIILFLSSLMFSQYWKWFCLIMRLYLRICLILFWLILSVHWKL